MLFSALTGQFILWLTAAYLGGSQELFDQVLSAKFEKRVMALQLAKRMDEQARSKATPFLVAIIAIDPLVPDPRKARNPDDALFTPKCVSLLILANSKDISLIELFLNNIMYFSYDPFERQSSVPALEYAAVRGLIRNGSASIKPCLRELAKDTLPSPNQTYRPISNRPEELKRYRKSNLIYVIHSLVGYQETLSLLESEIKRIEADDAEGADNLKKAKRLFLTNYRNK